MNSGLGFLQATWQCSTYCSSFWGAAREARGFCSISDTYANVRVETPIQSPRFPDMSLTVDQIVEAVRRLPREQSVELFDLLLAETIDSVDLEIQQSWKTEIHRRIAEIESGAETGVPGEEALAELRRVIGR